MQYCGWWCKYVYKYTNTCNTAQMDSSFKNEWSFLNELSIYSVLHASVILYSPSCHSRNLVEHKSVFFVLTVKEFKTGWLPAFIQNIFSCEEWKFRCIDLKFDYDYSNIALHIWGYLCKHPKHHGQTLWIILNASSSWLYTAAAYEVINVWNDQPPPVLALFWTWICTFIVFIQNTVLCTSCV